MFRLSDITPTLNPVRGGSSGNSLAEAYKLAVNSMDIRNFTNRNKEYKLTYDDIIMKLAEEVPHPNSTTEKVKLIRIYRQLQEE